MTPSSSDHPSRDDAQDQAKPVQYPTNYVIGVLETSAQSNCAVDALVHGGFLESEIELGAGPRRPTASAPRPVARASATGSSGCSTSSASRTPRSRPRTSTSRRCGTVTPSWPCSRRRRSGRSWPRSSSGIAAPGSSTSSARWRSSGCGPSRQPFTMNILSPEISAYLDGLVPPRPAELQAMERRADETGFPIIGPAAGQSALSLGADDWRAAGLRVGLRVWLTDGLVRPGCNREWRRRGPPRRLG